MRTFFIVNSSREQNEIALSKIKNNKQLALFACDIARSVLPIWLKEFSDDKTVTELIQTTENFIFDLTDLKQLNIAKQNTNTASNAASNAAYYAASNAYNAASNAVYYAANAAFAASNAAYFAASNAAFAASNAAYYAAYNAFSNFYAASDVANASNNKEDQWDFVYNLYLQTFKPNHIIIPKLPIFKQIANEIKSTRNFKLYNILKDAIMDYSNIKINTKCLGLSNWLLFTLLIK